MDTATSMSNEDKPEMTPTESSQNVDVPTEAVVSEKSGENGRRPQRKNQTTGKDTESVVVNPVIDRGLEPFLKNLSLVEPNADVAIESVLHFDVRAGGSDKGKVQFYAECMKDGIVFPNVILLRDTDGTLRMADGNHRIQAAAAIGRNFIRADIYEGGINECIDIGLAANRHGNGLKPQDIVYAVTQKMGKSWKIEDVNLSELSRSSGFSRPTLRKYLNQAKAGYMGMAKSIKLPKSDEEKARELAAKVTRMVDEGGSQVIPFIFENLSPLTRYRTLSSLRSTFPDEPSAS